MPELLTLVNADPHSDLALSVVCINSILQLDLRRIPSAPKPEQGLASLAFGGGNPPNPFSQDREFPLDTVELQSFNATHNEDVQKATIHYGPDSNESALSLAAIAFVIGSDIFFRSNKFNPTTEEGRQTLAHELTHVAQHQEGRITDKTTKEEKDELEDEAFQAEMREKYGDPDPPIAVRLSSGLFRFRKSKMEKIAYEWADIMLDEIKAQKWKARDEQEYLGFLLRIDEWVKNNFNSFYTPGNDAADDEEEAKIRENTKELTMLVKDKFRGLHW